MPDIEVTYPTDGSTVTATALNTLFTEVQDGINGLMAYGIRPGALRPEHFAGSLLQQDGWTNPAGVAAITVGGEGTHAYTRKYTTYGLNGAVDREICGSDQVGGGTFDNTNDRLVLESTGVRLGMDQSSNVAGLLCMWNVEFEQITQAQEADANAVRLMTCLQFRVSGTWYTLNRSERITPPRLSVGWADVYSSQDAATVVLLRQSDLTDKGLSAGSIITGIRVMVAVDNATASTAVHLNRCRLTVLPLHASL